MMRVRVFMTGSSGAIDRVAARVCVNCTRRGVIIEIMVIWVYHMHMHVAQLRCQREETWFPAEPLVLLFYVNGLHWGLFC